MNSLLRISATKKGSIYNISLVAANEIMLEWTITPKVSSSKIDVKFDIILTIKAQDEEDEDTIVPLKGNRTYNSISEFDVIAPEWAQDLSELLWSYLWALWWDPEYDQGMRAETHGEQGVPWERKEEICELWGDSGKPLITIIMHATKSWVLLHAFLHLILTVQFMAKNTTSFWKMAGVYFHRIKQ